MDKPLRPGEGIPLHHPNGVNLMPTDILLSDTGISMVNSINCETVLQQYLDTLREQYSHILIGCQPSHGCLHSQYAGSRQHSHNPCPGRVSAPQRPVIAVQSSK